MKSAIKKAADSLRWFSKLKPRLVQSRWAVNSTFEEQKDRVMSIKKIRKVCNERFSRKISLLELIIDSRQIY